MTTITVKTAASRLNVSPRRVRVLCAEGRITGAQKVGRDWLIPDPPEVRPSPKGPAGKWEQRPRS